MIERNSEFGEVSGEFLGDQTVGRDLPSEEALEPSDLIGLQPMGISKDADGLTLPWTVDSILQNTEHGRRDATKPPSLRGGCEARHT